MSETSISYNSSSSTDNNSSSSTQKVTAKLRIECNTTFEIDVIVDELGKSVEILEKFRYYPIKVKGENKVYREIAIRTM